jgi:CRISPR/Cas system-associated protein endoribonuclease Cas2
MLTSDQIEAARALAIEELADCDAFEAKGYVMHQDRTRYDTILAALDAYLRVHDRLSRFMADTESRRSLKLPHKEFARRDEELRLALAGE